MLHAVISSQFHQSYLAKFNHNITFPSGLDISGPQVGIICMINLCMVTRVCSSQDMVGSIIIKKKRKPFTKFNQEVSICRKIFSAFPFNFLLLNYNTYFFKSVQVGFFALKSRKSIKGSRVVVSRKTLLHPEDTGSMLHVSTHLLC